MTDEQLTVNRNAITIQGDGFDIDLMADAAWCVHSTSVAIVSCT